MRDKTHSEQIVRWARFIKTNDISVWKKAVKDLTDSQIIMANRFYSNLIKTDLLRATWHAQRQLIGCFCSFGTPAFSCWFALGL